MPVSNSLLTVLQPSKGEVSNFKKGFIVFNVWEYVCAGIEEQGLYRNCGVTSKVQRLLQIGLDKRQFEKISLDDDREWEIKTITSAVKTFFR